MRCQAPQGSCAKREAVASFAKCQLLRANFYCPNSEAGGFMADRIKSTLLTQGVPLVWLIWMDRGRMSCMSCASRQIHAIRQAPGTSGTGGFAVTAERTLR
jgi:hypothetical protein